MAPSTALLISSTPSLVKHVEEVTGSIPNLGLEVFATCAAAVNRLASEDVVLVLIHVPAGAGPDEAVGLLRRLADSRRSVATLVLGDRHEAEQALTLLRLGAADYLSRPLDLSRLTYLVDVLTVRGRYQAANRPAASPPRPATPAVAAEDEFLYAPGSSIGKIMEQVRRVAPKDTTVLLAGETGTGKTKMAALIHKLSPRKKEPFLVVNCGALSPTLMESEMFGHVRGAFTGAEADRAGKFAAVGRGTLLLDDIDALPLNLQAKLLRAVEERVFEPVGSNKSQPMQARLIAASSRDLQVEAEAGRFRNDLFYRLNVVGFYLVALRERSTVVIEAMARQFIQQFSPRAGGQVQDISPAALAALFDYPWPGNIRELRNVIERAVALCPGEVIELDDLSQEVQAAYTALDATAETDEPLPAATLSGPVTLSRSKAAAETERIREALQRNNNNRARAAAELGICRMTLYKKLHRYGLMEAGEQALSRCHPA